MTFTLLFLAILGVTAGLEVGPVRLVNNERYISYNLVPNANNSLLECPLQLSQGEDLQKITWVLWNGQQQAGTYQWFPTGQGIATGLLEGVVNLSREDGGLELTELRYDLGGFYSCSATLTDGQMQEAAKWEALVIDTTSSSYAFGSTTANCTFITSMRAPAVFPPPTVEAGMHSEKRGGFYDEVPNLQWHKVVYPNKSTSYSFREQSFKIDRNTPSDAVFRFTLGVTKTNGTKIELFQTDETSFLWIKEGCSFPERGPHQVFRHSGIKNCREQLESAFPIRATMACEEGYHAEGEVTTVKMECDTETLTWTTEPRLEDLHCVIDETNPGGGGGGGRMASSPAALVVGTLLFSCLLYQ